MPVGNNPTAIAYNPSNHYMYVVNRNTVSMINDNKKKNFKDKLHGANPTVLWSGGGYHLLQPLDADIVLETQSIFTKFKAPSRKLMSYAENLMTDGKADSVHRGTVSFGNCMIRIPGRITRNISSSMKRMR
jgi:hypothetical protein